MPGSPASRWSSSGHETPELRTFQNVGHHLTIRTSGLVRFGLERWLIFSDTRFPLMRTKGKLIFLTAQMLIRTPEIGHCALAHTCVSGRLSWDHSFQCQVAGTLVPVSSGKNGGITDYITILGSRYLTWQDWFWSEYRSFEKIKVKHLLQMKTCCLERKKWCSSVWIYSYIFGCFSNWV